MPGTSAISRRSRLFIGFRGARQQAAWRKPPARQRICLSAHGAPNERIGRRGPARAGGDIMHKVAVIVGSIRKDSINRQIRTCADEACRGEARLRAPQDRRPAALQPGQRGEPATGGDPLQERGRGGRRRALRHAGAQPLDPRRHEERHRLGDPALRRRAPSGARSAPSPAPRKAASRPPSRSSICARSSTATSQHCSALQSSF